MQPFDYRPQLRHLFLVTGNDFLRRHLAAVDLFQHEKQIGRELSLDSVFNALYLRVQRTDIQLALEYGLDRINPVPRRCV